MNTPQPNQTKKVTTTIQLTTNVAADGFVELLVDVAGAYVIRDKLKASGFRFVRDDQAFSDNKANEKPSTAWRRILVAVPPEVSMERAVKGLEMAINDLEGMLQGVFEGARVRGAKAAALTLRQHWTDCDELTPVAERLAGLDSPWENVLKRPEFAA